MEDFYGPVITNKHGFGYIGAETATNNTGELSAIGRALIYVIACELTTRPLVIHYDSEYAASMADRK
eukprot:8865854-Heterocapsa_arctica.AAC.1